MVPSSSAERNPVELLAEEFAARYRRGERPSLSEYTERYPQYAEQIAKLFPALVLMEQLKPAGGDLTGDFSGASEEAAPRLERLGDYRILREIGRGGMGVVYEAEQVYLGCRVALIRTSSAWRSAPMVAFWPPPVGTTPHGFGTRGPASSCTNWIIPAGSHVSCSVPTVGSWPRSRCDLVGRSSSKSGTQ